ncbi:Benomyl/methotrexate resistance protein [Pyrenophora tritici-repentis]|nr:Benomyl/methotrexate resistance protein [Pyrenophora tritici-repentis]
MYVFISRPPKDKQPHGHEEGDEERGNETSFWGPETMESDTGFDAVADIPPVPHYAEHNTDGD